MHDSDSITLLPLGVDVFILVVTSLVLYSQSRRLAKILESKGLTNRFDGSIQFPADNGIDPQEFVQKGNPFRKLARAILSFFSLR